MRMKRPTHLPATGPAEYKMLWDGGRNAVKARALTGADTSPRPVTEPRRPPQANPSLARAGFRKWSRTHNQMGKSKRNPFGPCLVPHNAP